VHEYFNRFYDGRREKVVSLELMYAADTVRKSFLAGYMAGDGYVDDGGVSEYVTKSPILAQQIAILFNELYGLKPRWYWRTDKRNIYRARFSNKAQDSLANQVQMVPYKGWVYDVETESHTFRAGVGGILVSNTAVKEKEVNDYSVCSTWGILPHGFYLLDVWRGRVDFPKLKQVAVAVWEQWRPMAVLVEDASSGQQLIQELRSHTKIPVIAVPASNKIIRANTVSPSVEAGKVFLPRDAAWRPAFEHELEVFPSGAHDDQVDSMTHFLSWARLHVVTDTGGLTGVGKKSTWKE